MGVLSVDAGKEHEENLEGRKCFQPQSRWNKHRDDFCPIKVKAVGNGTRGSQPGRSWYYGLESFFATRDCPVHCRIFSRELLTGPWLRVRQPKRSPDAVKGPLGAKSRAMESH